MDDLTKLISALAALMGASGLLIERLPKFLEAWLKLKAKFRKNKNSTDSLEDLKIIFAVDWIALISVEGEKLKVLWESKKNLNSILHIEQLDTDNIASIVEVIKQDNQLYVPATFALDDDFKGKETALSLSFVEMYLERRLIDDSKIVLLLAWDEQKRLEESQIDKISKVFNKLVLNDVI